MTPEEGWQELLRRCPGLAAQYRQEMQHRWFKRITFAGVGVAVCLIVAASIYWVAKMNSPVQEVAIAGSARGTSLGTTRSGQRDNDDLALLPRVSPMTLLPMTSNNGYATWLSVNADWFTRQFPNAFLRQARGSEARAATDYVEPLASSGQLFRFPGEDKGLMHPASAPISGSSAWLAAVGTAEKGDISEQTNVLLFSLRVGQFLAHTREAAAFWAANYPQKAQTLLASHGSASLKSAFAMPARMLQAKELAEHFARQGTVARDIVRIAEDLLGSSGSAGCTVGSDPEWAQLKKDVQALDQQH